ncbi:MAG: hypothetical protein HYX36_14645 [Rhizobiales bacterium]|nr:hypothetical protein [Hyphomicrobiales bacterium]
MTRILAVVLSIVSALGLSACTRDFSWHQKLTVTVVTPAGERSGSAVLAVYVNSGKPFLTPNVSPPASARALPSNPSPSKSPTSR